MLQPMDHRVVRMSVVMPTFVFVVMMMIFMLVPVSMLMMVMSMLHMFVIVLVFVLVFVVVSHWEPPNKDVEVIGLISYAGTLNHGTAADACYRCFLRTSVMTLFSMQFFNSNAQSMSSSCSSDMPLNRFA